MCWADLLCSHSAVFLFLPMVQPSNTAVTWLVVGLSLVSSRHSIGCLWATEGAFLGAYRICYVLYMTVCFENSLLNYFLTAVCEMSIVDYYWFITKAKPAPAHCNFIQCMLFNALTYKCCLNSLKQFTNKGKVQCINFKEKCLYCVNTLNTSSSLHVEALNIKSHYRSRSCCVLIFTHQLCVYNCFPFVTWKNFTCWLCESVHFLFLWV